MNNKELIRCALMGDKQAQEKCTAQGIVLPCPCCCASVDIVCVPAHEHKILDLPAYQGGCFIECTGCTYAISGENKKEVLKAHNARPAPPVGRCGECKYGRKFSENDSQHDFHWEETEIFIICKEPYICTKWEVKTLHKPDEYCSHFEPREE